MSPVVGAVSHLVTVYAFFHCIAPFTYRRIVQSGFSNVPPGFFDFVQNREVLFQRSFFQTVNDFFGQFFDLQPEKRIHGALRFLSVI
jgi:hypothetical protein